MSTSKIIVYSLAFILLGCSNSGGAKGRSKNIYLKVADETLTLGNSEAALNFYDKALKSEPDCLQAKIGRVEALINMNKLEQAFQEAQVTLAKNPDCSDLIYAKGKIFLLRGNVDAAKKLFESLPKHYKALNALGTIYDARFDADSAQKYYRKAIAINSQYADAYGNLGLSLVLATDKVGEGIAYLERACSMTGSSFTQKNNLALAYGIAGDYEKAQAIYEEEMTPSEAALKVAQLKKIVVNKSKRK